MGKVSQAGLDQPLTLKISSDPAQIATARAAVELLAEHCGFDPAAQGEIGLCVNEALANVIRHAYHGATDQPITVQATCMGQALSISIRDWGNGINPMEQPRKQRDPLQPGGVGMICLEKLMHQVEFVRQPDGMLLTMVRRKTGALPPASAKPG